MSVFIKLSWLFTESNVYIDGVRFLEFDVRARPRSVTCVHKTLTPRMKHTRVPGRYAEISGGLLWKLCLYQALAFFEAESGIRSKVESKIGKRRTDRTDLNALQIEKPTYLVPHWIITGVLGLIDVVQCLHKLRTLASYKQSLTRKFHEPILLLQTERVSFA